MAIFNISLLAGLNQQVYGKFMDLLSEIQATGFDVRLNSVYRSFAKQQQLRNEMGNKAARPGYSPHNYGIGIDMNIIDRKTGKTYLKATSKKEWESTGIPLLTRRKGFRWGGDFSLTGTGGYDPIHVDLANVFPTANLLAETKRLFGEDTSKVRANELDLSKINPSVADGVADIVADAEIMVGNVPVNVIPFFGLGISLVVAGVFLILWD